MSGEHDLPGALAGRHLVGGRWVEGGGEAWESVNPATGGVLWRGRTAGRAEVGAAVEAARAAGEAWGEAGVEAREEFLRRYQAVLERHREALALALCRETGKPWWEARQEVQAMIGKIPLALEARRKRAETFTGGPAVTRFKPHGVVAVLGPYNLPGHLPNGHLAPALLAGNTAVFKPSEQTPLAGEMLVRCLVEAGCPAGVVNLVQGGRETGQELAGHPGIDGLFFTGSARTGEALARLLAERPGKILALELGGNNPLVVDGVADLEAAALATVQSAYVTSGQRCTCARRLIVPAGAEGDAFLERLVGWIGRLRVGPPEAEPPVFMGSMISAAAAEGILEAQARLAGQGGRVLAEARRLVAGTGIVTPGLIEVTGVADPPDEEYFGPLLQVIRVADFAEALAEANRTAFGLAAGLLSDDRAKYELFWKRSRAGIINWNQPLTGASGAAPFGGVGRSGNFRPSGFFAADYCAYPVASIEQEVLPAPEAGKLAQVGLGGDEVGPMAAGGGKGRE